MNFICLLRGINVSGKNLIKMEALRTSMSGLGLTDVRTYVQSGNVVFRARSAAGLERKVEAMLLADFGCTVPTVVRSADELGEIIRANPFVSERDIDATKLHVTFLSEPPAKAGLAKLAAIACGPDRFCVAGREVYLHCPKGYGVSKLSNTALERALGVRATTRNWKTVTTLLQLAA